MFLSLFSSFTNRLTHNHSSNRRRSSAVAVCGSVDQLECRTLLTGPNQPPQITVASGYEGHLMVGIDDDNPNALLEVKIDVHNDGTIDGIYPITAGGDLLINLNSYIVGNTTEDVKVTAVETVYTAMGAETLTSSTVVPVPGVTVTATELDWFSEESGAIAGGINDLSNVTGTVHLVIREVGQTIWGVYHDFSATSDFFVIMDRADGIKDVEISTMTIAYGASVFGSIHTVTDMSPWNPGSSMTPESGSFSAASWGSDSTPGSEPEDDFWADYPFV